jgi:glycerol dehydrogenase
MKKILIAPNKFVLGEGELLNLGTYAKDYGEKILMVASKDDQSRVQQFLDQAIKLEKFEMISGEFKEECTKAEIDRLRQVCTKHSCQIIVGLGGGKALDTAKAIAHYEKLPVFIIPTIASTDAPCSSLAVIYKANGEFEEYMFFRKNPDLVLVDSKIIANAPVRFLISGMGDALATYFEARSCERAYAKNIPGGNSTLAALAIARLCYDTLMEESEKAIAACTQKVVTTALENIIEANILLSGLGFESSGLATAHAVHDGLTVLEETHKYYHGEKVAFGTLVHLVLENAKKEEIKEVIAYCKAVGLPTCLADLGVTNATQDKVMAIAIAACAEGETIHNTVFKVTPEMVYAAIYTADKLGGNM